MKTFILSTAIALVTLRNFAGINDVYVTYYNDTGANIYAGQSAPEVDLLTQFASIGVYNYPANFTAVFAFDCPTGETVDVDYNAGGGGLGYPDCSKVIVRAPGNTSGADTPFFQGGDNYGVQVTGTISLVNGRSYTPPPPTTTNVTQCIQNTTSQAVNATASVGGSVIGTAVIPPGGTWCQTATLPLDGSSSFNIGYTVPSPTGSNPFGEGTNTWSYNAAGGGSTTQTSTGPDSGMPVGTGGGASTNVYTATYTNYETSIFTNNINYATHGTNIQTGLALDSTMRSIGGALHSDNISLATADGVIHTDLQTLGTDMNGVVTMAQVQTNLAGQMVALLYHLTNSDQLPVYINTVTNNATEDAQKVVNEIDRSFDAITNALAQNAGTNGTHDFAADGSLSNIEQNISSIAEVFTNLTDGSNADFATETTQIGISNLLANGLNVSNGPAWTNGLTLGQLTNLQQMNSNAISAKLQDAINQIQASTNVVGAFASGGASLVGGMDNNLHDSGLIASPEIDIPLSTSGVVLAMGTGIPVELQTAQGIIRWMIYFMLAAYGWKRVSTGVSKILTTGQAGTAGEEILGNNVNFASALVMAGLIIGITLAFFAGGVAVLVSWFGAFGSTPFSGLTTTFGYELLASTIPIDLVVSSLIVIFIFNVTIDSACMVAMGMVKFLVGL